MLRLVTKRSVIVLLLINVMFLSCKGNYTKEDSAKQIAVSELGKERTIDFNETKTYALCQQQRINDHPERILKYIVVNVSTKKIVQRGSFQSGYVKWISNESIEVATSDKASPDMIKNTIRINSTEQ